MIKPKERKKIQRTVKRWAIKHKEEVYTKLGRKCNSCGTVEDLSIHHKKYEVGIEYLEILCNKCHRDFHNLEFKKRLLIEIIKRVRKYSGNDVSGLIDELQNEINNIPVEVIPNMIIDGFEK